MLSHILYSPPADNPIGQLITKPNRESPQPDPHDTPILSSMPTATGTLILIRILNHSPAVAPNRALGTFKTSCKPRPPPFNSERVNSECLHRGPITTGGSRGQGVKGSRGQRRGRVARTMTRHFHTESRPKLRRTRVAPSKPLRNQHPLPVPRARSALNRCDQQPVRSPYSKVQPL
jgi:hypothetical protein